MFVTGCQNLLCNSIEPWANNLCREISGMEKFRAKAKLMLDKTAVRNCKRNLEVLSQPPPYQIPSPQILSSRLSDL